MLLNLSILYRMLSFSSATDSTFAATKKIRESIKAISELMKTRKKPIVVGIGELLWDLLPTGRKAGGAPINFVYHASHLGADGYAISAIGDDELGRDIIDELKANNIQHLIEKVPYPTGTVQVELNEGIPTYQINERVAWDHIAPTSNALDLAEQADVICFGSLAQRSSQSRETIQAILSFAPETAYRIFDVNLRQHYYSKELIEESLYLSNVMKMNEEELYTLKKLFNIEGSEEEISLWFLEKYNLRLVALTAGANYSALYTANEKSVLQTPKIEVCDTVGAGDAFTSAMIISLLKGEPLKTAHQFAIQTAAFVCSKEGAWPAY